MLATIFWAAAPNSDSYSGLYSSSNIQILASRTQILDKWKNGWMVKWIDMLYIWGHYPAPPSTFLTNHLSKAPVLLTIYCLWVAILLVGDTQLYLAMSVHQWVCQSVYWSIGWEYWNLVGLVDCVLGKDIKAIDHFHFSGSESGIKSFCSHISSFRSLLGI